MAKLKISETATKTEKISEPVKTDTKITNFRNINQSKQASQLILSKHKDIKD